MKQRSSYLKRLSLLSMLFLGICSMAIAQRTITGTITDANTGEGLIGANVLVLGTSSGAATDIDGSYTVDVPDGATELEISYTGYTTQVVTIGASNVLDIQLLEGSLLDEVVVTGYGTVKQKEVTSSITSVDAEDFNQGNINDATQALQGKVPGLQIYNKGGNPNSAPAIRLRGISTVGANAQPLVVIDGVIGASLDNVDPNDIENISVLKDGSASAIYGSRGSSGVILVTTKGGNRGGKVMAEYNGYVSSASVDNNISVMNKAQYTAAGGNDLGSNTDWQDEVTRNAISNVHNLSVSGGSDNTTFRLSTNFRDIQGVLKKSGFDQINARANINHYALDDKLNINFNMALTNRNSDFSFNEALRYAALFNPTAPIRFDNGEFFQAILFDNFNPVAILEQNQNVGTRRTLNFNAQATYEIVDGLKWTANFGQQYQNNLNGEFYPNNSFFRGLNRGGLARRYTDDNTSTVFETYGTYDTQFGGTTMSLTGGYSFQETDFQSLFIEAGNLPSNALGFNALEISADVFAGAGSGQLAVNSDANLDERIIAFFGRVNLNFNENITLSASLRREGSTRLGADNRWGTFPAVSVGVDVGNMANLNGFDQLKVRIGYGVTGSLPAQSGLSQSAFNYSFGGGGTVSQDATREPNPDLSWEEKAELNFGVDFALMDYKLTGSLDLYNRTISDFITSVTSTDPAFTNKIGNFGELSTTGFEAAINYNGIGKGEFSWTPGIVLSTYKTTLDEFLQEAFTSANLGSPGQNGTNMIRVAVGEEIGQIWGPVFTGVSSEGTPEFADLNGDGMIVSDQGSALDPSGDFQQLGSGIPSLEIGWNNQFIYKNWDMTAFFRGAFGHSLVNTFRAFYEPIDPGAIQSYNRIVTDLAPNGLTSAQFSSLYVEKADFLRLDNVTLGYTFDLGGNSSFSKIRVYANVQNAFTITGYTGIDPEPVLQDFGPIGNGGTPNLVPDVLSPGIDRRNNYFTARTFTFGLNVGF